MKTCTKCDKPASSGQELCHLHQLQADHPMLRILTNHDPNYILKEALDDTKLGGIRYNSDKRRWSLVDFDALEDMVKVLEFGAQKYADDNWKKGLKTTEICESMLRHITAYLSGEDNDPESGLPHTGHILCNGMFLAYMHKFNSAFDTRAKDPNKNVLASKV